MKRMRGRNHRPSSGGGSSGGFRNQQNGIPLNRNHVFDSSGPEMRVRGTAQQLYDKYQQMARDAFSNGDRVTGESYYQHAEHYFRIISAINQAQGVPNPPQNGQNGQPYQANGQDRSQDRSQDRGHYQDRNNYNADRDYNRRDQNAGDVSTEPQPEPRQDTRPETPRFEPRPTQYRHNDPRNPEPRSEFRPPKPDYQRQARPERQDRNEQRFRPPEPPAAEMRIDPRIDISSALEAELAATLPEPAQPEFAGFGEQPVIQTRTEPRPESVEKPRSIPIIPDAPPPAAPAAEEPAIRTPRPRGRPRAVKPEAEKASE